MSDIDFTKAGFTVVGAENNENKLLRFLKENYPNVIRDTEINLEELKTVLGLPIDEKVNGYGLNFVGRNFPGLNIVSAFKYHHFYKDQNCTIQFRLTTEL